MDSEEQWYQYHKELYHILMCLSRHSFQPGAENASGRPLDRFIHCVEIVHKEYDSPLSASVLAERIGFSEPTIYRLFQEHMGVSLTRYLNSVRVSAACGLMENLEGCSMTEIAEQCGFTSLSNFYRTFRQFVGVPPGNTGNRDRHRLACGVCRRICCCRTGFSPLAAALFPRRTAAHRRGTTPLELAPPLFQTWNVEREVCLWLVRSWENSVIQKTAQSHHLVNWQGRKPPPPGPVWNLPFPLWHA